MLNNQSNQKQSTLGSFFNYSMVEAQALNLKLKNLVAGIKEGSVGEAKQLQASLAPALEIVESYYSLIHNLIQATEDRSKTKAFFPISGKQGQNLIFQVYPQSMSVAHYREVFEICGIGKNMNYEKINQITIKRLQAYQKFQVIQKEIYLQDSYMFNELQGVLREEKIKEIVNDFWGNGRLQQFDYIIQSRGGRLAGNENLVKIFEVPTPAKTADGKDIFYLLYVTPAFYSYRPDSIIGKQKGNYNFVSTVARNSTSIVEMEKTFFRHHFTKPVGESDEMRFSLRIKLPINIYRFEVTKG